MLTGLLLWSLLWATLTAETASAESGSGMADPGLIRSDLAPPVADLASTYVSHTGQSTIFNASQSKGAITQYAWDFDDDGVYEEAGTNPVITHIFQDPGTYRVTVRVTDTNGLMSTASFSISIVKAPPDPPRGPRGVSINDGAAYTNDPMVEIYAVWPAGRSEMLVSNDGGFKHAKREPIAHITKWKLASSGPERLPKTVYVRFGGMEGYPGNTVDGLTFDPFGGLGDSFQDDIILDQTKPLISGASIDTVPAATSRRSLFARPQHKTAILQVRARDNISGVRWMQVAYGRPGRWLDFHRRVELRGIPHRLRLRVKDRAGNVSGWRVVSS